VMLLKLAMKLSVYVSSIFNYILLLLLYQKLYSSFDLYKLTVQI
jgi:hypothetical protein